MSEIKTTQSAKFSHGSEVTGAWSKSLESGYETCVICDRPVGSRVKFVHFVEGGAVVYANGATDAIDAAGDMGFWSVGSECAKQFERGVLFDKAGA
jgi:hypothetical protein